MCVCLLCVRVDVVCVRVCVWVVYMCMCMFVCVRACVRVFVLCVRVRVLSVCMFVRVCVCRYVFSFLFLSQLPLRFKLYNHPSANELLNKYPDNIALLHNYTSAIVLIR